MAIQNVVHIAVRLEGLRPLMFDRYAGDNNTQLQTVEKMYLTPTMGLVMPALNVLSLLTAQNTSSVSRQFFGKNGKAIALGINSYTALSPFEIPICDDNGPIFFTEWNAQISIEKHVARLAKGIPNPKIRPVLALPWHLDFNIDYIDNKHCTLENLRQAVDMGGILGLGTFKPVYGRYALVRWEVS